MIKTLLAATTALTLISGVGFAETTYSNTRTESSTGMAPSHDVDIHKTVKTNGDGMVEKEKTVKRTDGDDSHVSMQFGHDRDHDLNKDKTVTKSTDVSPTGDVTKQKSVTTTVR